MGSLPCAAPQLRSPAVRRQRRTAPCRVAASAAAAAAADNMVRSRAPCCHTAAADLVPVCDPACKYDIHVRSPGVVGSSA